MLIRFIWNIMYRSSTDFVSIHVDRYCAWIRVDRGAPIHVDGLSGQLQVDDFNISNWTSTATPSTVDHVHMIHCGPCCCRGPIGPVEIIYMELSTEPIHVD